MMPDQAITDSQALAHIRSALAKLQKAVASLEHDAVTAAQLHAALGQTMSASRSMKRASECMQPLRG